MPPKRKTESSASASGQKRKRETKAEKLARVKAEWAKNKKNKAEEELNDNKNEEEEVKPPAKRARLTPKSNTGGRRKKAAEAPSPTRSSSRRQTDAPVVGAKTPPRSAASTKPNPLDRAGFQSPNPTGSGSKAPPPNEEDSEDEAIPVPIPYPDFPLVKTEKKASNPGVLPVPAKKEDSPKAEAAVAAPEDLDEDDEGFDDHSGSSLEGEEDDSVGMIQGLDQIQNQDDQGLDAAAPKNKWSFFSALVTLVIVTALGYSFWSFVLPALQETSPASTICFYDSPHSQHEQKVKTVSACRDNDETPVVWEYCPSDAYCRGGSLLKCPDGFSVASEGCILTEQSKETLEAMIGLLQSWTAQDVCKGHTERHEEYGFGDRPLFHYSRVTGELEMGYNLALIKHANSSRFLLKSSDGGDVWIGLHPNVPVPLSYLCIFKYIVYFLLGAALKMFYFALYVVGSLLKLLFDSFWEDPLFVGGGLFGVVAVGFLLWRKHKESNARLRLENDIVQCRKLVWKILSDEPSKAFQFNELVEKVQWDHEPMSMKGRTRVAKVVMPRIVEDLRSDTRIKNIRKLEKGKPVDAFQWKESSTSGLAGQ